MLTYLSGFPGLTGLPHPGRFRRSGKPYRILLFKPSGSPAMTAVKGSPEDSCNSVPSCQPFASPWNGFHPLLGPGTSHVPLTARICGVSKSDTAFRRRGSNTGRFETVFVYAVMSEFEPVSRLLDQVYDPWTSRPWLRRFCSRTGKAL